MFAKTPTTLTKTRHCDAPPEDAWQALELLHAKLCEVVASGAAMRALAADMKSPRVMRRVRLSVTERFETGACFVARVWHIPVLRVVITAMEPGRSLHLSGRTLVLRAELTFEIAAEASGCALTSRFPLPGLAGRLARADPANITAPEGQSAVDAWALLAEHVHEPDVLSGKGLLPEPDDPPLWNSPE